MAKPLIRYMDFLTYGQWGNLLPPDDNDTPQIKLISKFHVRNLPL